MIIHKYDTLPTSINTMSKAQSNYFLSVIITLILMNTHNLAQLFKNCLEFFIVSGWRIVLNRHLKM